MQDKPRDVIASMHALSETSAVSGGPAVLAGRRAPGTWCDLLLDELGQDGFADTEPMTFLDATLTPVGGPAAARR